jgi:uncharacterized protein
VTTLVAVGVSLFVVAILLNWVTLRILKPVRAPIERTPQTMGLEAEEIEFSSDGRTLRGWFLDGDTKDSRPLVILAHGWGANTGAVLPLGEAFGRIGLDVLMFDFRNHGRSDDAPRVTMLDYARDLDAAVWFARKRFSGRRIVLVGHSMGGAASVLAVADGTEADALLLVAAPADFFDVTANYLGGGIRGMLLLALTGPFFLLHVRRWWTSIAPDRHIADVKVPISIVQGDRDQRVPLSHVYRLAEQAGVEPLVLDDTGHIDILYSEILHAHALEFVNSLR